MKRLKLRVDRDPRAFLRAFMAAEEPISRAATAAVGAAGERIKAAARADIAAAGFSRSWQNALRVDGNSRGGEVSVNAAAHVYRRIPYAWVHEEGATIGRSPSRRCRKARDHDRRARRRSRRDRPDPDRHWPDGATASSRG